MDVPSRELVELLKGTEVGLLPGQGILQVAPRLLRHFLDSLLGLGEGGDCESQLPRLRSGTRRTQGLCLPLDWKWEGLRGPVFIHSGRGGAWKWPLDG